MNISTNIKVLSLLSRLKKLDVYFYMEGSQLKINAPKGRLTSNLLNEIKEQKPAIVEFLRNTQKQDRYFSINPVEKKEYYALSSAQKRLYILDRLETGKTSYNTHYVIPQEQEPEKGKLEKIFRKLTARHESLRTSFITVNDEPVQEIHDEVEFTIEYDELSKDGTRGLAPLSIPATHNPQHATALISSFIRPFDLSRAPLLRVALIKTNEKKYFLLVDMHHIITDGTSQGILKNEFMSLFRNPERESSPLRLQYKDFSEWQNSEKEVKRLKQQESYWWEEFPGEIPVLHLPIDYPRPQMQSFEGCTVDFLLEENETRMLKDIAKETDATLYMVLLSVYTILLSKLSGQEDIVVGTPIAARRHADLESIVGMFVNTLAIRNYPGGERTFKNFLIEVKQRTLASFENQEYQFEDLVDKVSVQRDTSRNPIFDVMFNLLNQADYIGHAPVGNDQLQGYKHKKGTAKFDLNFTAVDMGKQLFFSLEYCSRLFKASTIDKIIGYFRNTVAFLGVNNNLKLSALDILSEEEKALILNLSRGVPEEIAPGETIPRWFETQATQTPDHIAVVGPQAGTRGLAPLPASLSITYNRLNHRSNQLAKFLREQGVRRDTVVGLIVERSIEMIVGILAVLKAGGAYLPIDAQYPDERKKYMLRDSQVNLLLTNFDMEKTGYTPGNIHRIDLRSEDIYHGEGRSPEHINRDADLLYMIYTSGSTGKPKGVLLEHRNLVNLFRFQYRYTNLDCSRILQFATLSFDASFHEIFSTLLAGGTLYLIEKETRTNVPELFKLISKNEIKTVFLPMSFLKLIFQEEQYVNRIPACIDHIQTAGEQVIVDNKFREYLKKAKVYLHNHYGPSETHVATTLTLDPRGDIPQLPPIGKPVSNTAIYLLDKNKHLLPEGVPGELYIAGSQVARGYLNQPELTGEKFDHDLWDYQDYHDEEAPFGQIPLTIHNSQLTINNSSLPPIYRTGDMARWLPDGNIQFLGRKDRQVKIRGFRIELGEIESQLLTHEAIQEAVVIAENNEGGSKLLCAYYVEKPGKQTGKLNTNTLREYLSKSLTDHMIPSYFVSLDIIPLTPTGKLDRKALPGPEARDEEYQYTAPGNEREEKLAELWSKVLGIEKEKISVTHDFYKLGGDSMKAIRLISSASRENIHFDIKDLYEYKTIKEVAKIVKFDKRKTSQEEVSGEILLLPIQKKTFAQNIPHPEFWNVIFSRDLHDQVDTEILEKSIDKMIQHHDALRINFSIENGKWKQINRKYEEVDFHLKYITLDDLDPGKQQKKMRDEIYKMHCSLDLEKDLLIRAVVFDFGKGRKQLFISIHHFICDVVSREIFVEDLEDIYYKYTQNPEIEMNPKTTSFMEWAKKLNSQIKLEDIDVSYWKNLYLDRIDYLVEKDIKDISSSNFSMSISIFGKENTKALKAITTMKYDASMEEMLLSALVISLHDSLNLNNILIELESHGRAELFEDVDLSRTIGWFTNAAPVVLEYKGYMKRTIENTKQVLRGLPYRGIYYNIAKYILNVDVPDLTPYIAFNYQGEFSYQNDFNDKPKSLSLFESRQIPGNTDETEIINAPISIEDIILPVHPENYFPYVLLVSPTIQNSQIHWFLSSIKNT